MTSRLSDEEINELLSALWLEHGGMLTKMSCGILRDWHMAEDTVNEALTALGESLAGGEVVEDPLAWMKTAVYNQTISRGRKETSHRLRTDKLAVLAKESAFTAFEEDVGETDFSDLDPEAVRAALHSLPARQQEVIGLRLFMELSIQETAERMECAENVVRMTQSRAIRTLRTLLTPL